MNREEKLSILFSQKRLIQHDYGWLIGARPTLTVVVSQCFTRVKNIKNEKKEIVHHLKHVICIKANANYIHVWDNSSGTEIIEANYLH